MVDAGTEFLKACHLINGCFVTVCAAVLIVGNVCLLLFAQQAPKLKGKFLPWSEVGEGKNVRGGGEDLSLTMFSLCAAVKELILHKLRFC